MSSPLKITWIVPDHLNVMGLALSSNRVDVRLRALLPGQALADRGHHVECVSFYDLQEWSHNPQSIARDIYIFGKTLIDLRAVVRYIRQGHGRIIMDLCDNVFEPPEDGPKPHTVSMLPHVDGVVTSTD